MPNGKQRLVLNFRRINAACRKLRCRFEQLRDLPNILRRGDYMLSMDLAAAFWHVPMAKTSQRFVSWHLALPPSLQSRARRGGTCFDGVAARRCLSKPRWSGKVRVGCQIPLSGARVEAAVVRAAPPIRSARRGAAPPRRQCDQGVVEGRAANALEPGSCQHFHDLGPDEGPKSSSKGSAARSSTTTKTPLGA